MKKKVTATIISQQEIEENIFDLRIETELAKEAHCGQFIGVFPEDGSRLLPRPISICEVEDDKNRLRLVYRIAGKGTKEFSEYSSGEKLQVLGILGNGFPMEQTAGKRVILMGGGIGIPPMLQTAKELKKLGNDFTMIMGYRNSKTFLEDEFASQGKLILAIQDGSRASSGREQYTGNVIEAAKAAGIQADTIMACGPMPMLKAIKYYASENGMKAYVSLEERMACGVGACLGCVAKTRDIDQHSKVHNARICTDGPVFDADILDL